MRTCHNTELWRRYCETGFEGMTDEEMLTLMILVSGKKQEDAEAMAKTLLHSFGNLSNILRINPKRLAKQPGIDVATAVYISLFRVTESIKYKQKNKGKHYLSKTEDIKRYVENLLKYAPVESFLVITIGNRNRIISTEILFEGTINGVNIEIRKVLELVFDDNAKGAIIAHNHPGGNGTPSLQDIMLTEKLKSRLEHFNIKLIDHIIVGSDNVISLKADTDYIEFAK